MAAERHKTMSSLIQWVLLLWTVASLVGGEGCSRPPTGPTWELAKIGATVIHTDPDSLGVGYQVLFGNPGITDLDLENLDRLPAPEIIVIDLSETRVTDSGLTRLAAFSSLRNLALNGTSVSDKGLQDIGRLTELRTLELRNTQITGTELSALRSLPHLQSIDLAGAKLTDDGLSRTAFPTQLQSLDTHNTAVSDDGARRIAEIVGLRWFSGGPMISDAGLASLSQLSSLEELHLRGRLITDAGIQHLRALTELRRLTLRGTNVTASAVQDLKQALPQLDVAVSAECIPFSPSVRTHEEAVREIEAFDGSVTVLAGHQASVCLRAPLGMDEAFISLVTSFDQLRSLQCAGGWLSDAGLRQLPPLNDLRSLSLRGDTFAQVETAWIGAPCPMHIRDTWVGDNGLAKLSAVTQLESLDLTGAYVTDGGLPFAARLVNLQELGLQNTSVTGNGLVHLQSLVNLRVLDLTHTAVDDSGIEHLHALPHLETLFLGRTLVTDAGMATLTEFKELKCVHLEHTRITDAGLKQLAKMQNLEEVFLDSTLTTEEGVAAARRALPGARFSAELIGDHTIPATDAQMMERTEFFP